MDPFFAPVNLGLGQVQAIVQGMYKIACADKCHENELVMIRQFYEACRADAHGLAAFEDLIAIPFDADRAKDALDSPELQEAFLKSVYLLAFADGHLTPAETRAIDEMVASLGISKDLARQIQDLVIDRLLRQVARSSNVQIVRKIATDLASS